jgi:hypothetical protein
MNITNIFSLAFLAILIAGIAISISVVCFVVFKIFFGADEEVLIPILKDSKQNAELTQTPVFGEIEWVIMVGTALVMLTVRGLGHNASKVAMQLKWKSGESETVVPSLAPIFVLWKTYHSIVCRCFPFANPYLLHLPFLLALQFISHSVGFLCKS